MSNADEPFDISDNEKYPMSENDKLINLIAELEKKLARLERECEWLAETLATAHSGFVGLPTSYVRKWAREHADK